uniref:Stomatal closure-related actin-binding protein Ig domain-containing protein n=1 Tax=Tanacetum cinerariifolium TaxID=118510 RepID=A0A699GUH4_TANCI|nr:hypothetical protein [Tanacetum cinerariifolium]
MYTRDFLLDFSSSAIFTAVASLLFWQWQLSSLAVGTASGSGNSIPGNENALCILFPTILATMHYCEEHDDESLMPFIATRRDQQVGIDIIRIPNTTLLKTKWEAFLKKKIWLLVGRILQVDVISHARSITLATTIAIDPAAGLQNYVEDTVTTL